ncbi:MAG: DUF4936 family protein [Burkholderiaceae bacterium]|nr:DUF4936 family protein [Roseateles sp.]MBV8471520.1 DUF4936 family protein [Burkholderiaceae bacterium]
MNPDLVNNRELYVYYKLDPLDAPAARQALDAARLRLSDGVNLRLLERQEAQASNAITWMEVYNCADGHADLDAAQHAVADALAPFCKHGRHVERFRPL